MPNVTVGTVSTTPDNTAEPTPAGFFGTALGLSGFEALWPCQQLLNRVVDNQTPLRRVTTPVARGVRADELL
jgi:hypothetical protein